MSQQSDAPEILARGYPEIAMFLKVSKSKARRMSRSRHIIIRWDVGGPVLLKSDYQDYLQTLKSGDALDHHKERIRAEIEARIAAKKEGGKK